MKTFPFFVAFLIITGCSESSESNKCTVDIALEPHGVVGCTGQGLFCSPDIVENNDIYSITSASCQTRGTGDVMDSCTDSSDCYWGLGCFFGRCELLCSSYCSNGECIQPGWLTVEEENYGVCVATEDCFGIAEDAVPCMEGFQCSYLIQSGIPAAFETYLTGCTHIQDELPQGEPCDNTQKCAAGLICSGTVNPEDQVICRPVCEYSEDCITIGSSVGTSCSTDVVYNEQIFMFKIYSVDVGVCMN